MRKLIIILFCLTLVFTFSVPAMAKGGKDKCTTIKDETIEYGRVGEPSTEIIPIGYDQWGYNYQAHLFNGYYGNYSRPDVLVTEGTWLMMKWSDTWLSNKDCNDDVKLDRGYDCDSDNASSSACLGAWLTNHQSGTYFDEEDNECKWIYFVKIVAVPEDTQKSEDGLLWLTVDGEMIGSVIWGAYAIIQQISNDPCAGEHGALYVTPVGPGFGKFK